jgi:phospholipid transport system substrate-binding protein
MIKSQMNACLIALAIAVGAPGLSAAATGQDPATAPAATDSAVTDPGAKQISAFYAALLDSMKHAKTVDVNGRYKMLAPVIDATFDLPTMTKMIIGPGWDGMSDADHQALIAAFRRMTIANYARNFDGYSGEAFTVDPKVVERSGDKVVSSQMTAPGRPSIPFLYRMTKTPGGWKVIDVFLNGYVSEVATRRADFASTLKAGGAKALVEKINALSARALAPGN